MPEVNYRFIKVEPSSIREDATGDRTFQASFSSEQPVLRRDGNGKAFYEVLSHQPEHADLSRLQGGALLDEHRPESQTGAVVRAWIDAVTRKGRALLKLAKTKLGEERFVLMRDGIRNSLSVGYELLKVVGTSMHPDGTPIKRFAWRALEISSVAVPADVSVGVGRSSYQFNKQQQRHKITMQKLDDKSEIIATQKLIGHDNPHIEPHISELTSRALLTNMSERAYKDALLELIRKNPKPEIRMRVDPHELGMSSREVGQYSIVRAIRSSVENGGRLEKSFERDVSEQLERNTGQRAEGFFIPTDILVTTGTRSLGAGRRDLYTGEAASGGFMVQTEVQTPVIEILRNRMICGRLGATMLNGCVGNVTFPQQTSTATAQSVGEIDALTDSQLSLAQIGLSPKRIGATTTVGKQLILQSTPDAEALTRDDLFQTIATRQDYLLLNGKGSNNEPLGVMNTVGVQSVVFGGAATWDKVVSFETLLGQANADISPMAYATTPDVRGKWKSTAIALTGATTVSSTRLWDKGNFGDGSNDGLVNDYRAAATNQIPNNLVLFGRWSELIHAIWGGWDMVVDPYTKAKNAEIVLTVNTWMDAAVRHAQSFVVSSDSGAQ